MALTLMKGSEAIAEAAIRAGARYFFGYPITPQTEIPEYMSARMPEIGGCFLQAESEVAAINMVYGAAGTGARVITSSSSPGVSLKQEGISYCAGAMVPAVIINVMRGGPGLGNIQASQGDYFQGVKGGGNGDYHLLTFAPASVQEAIDLMMIAYEKAEKYRIPVLFLADGIIAQMMEPVELPEMVDYKVDPEEKPWACTGWKPGDDPAKRGVINSIYIDTESLAVHNDELHQSNSINSLYKRSKGLVLCNEVGLGVYFDYTSGLAVCGDSCTSNTFCCDTACFLLSLSLSVLSQELNSCVHISIGLVQSLLTIHHTSAGHFTELFYHRCGNCHFFILSS